MHLHRYPKEVSRWHRCLGLGNSTHSWSVIDSGNMGCGERDVVSEDGGIGEGGVIVKSVVREMGMNLFRWRAPRNTQVK